MTKTVRNVAIVLALAAAVRYLPGGGPTANTLSTILSIGFFGGLVWFTGRLYVQNRSSIDLLPDRARLMLYVAVAVLVLTLVGTSRLWNAGGAGVLLWLGLMLAALYALYAVYRLSREY